MKQEHKSKMPRVACALVACVLIICALVYAFRENKVAIGQYNSVARPPEIYPDYSRAVIPPNIAPLNFLIQESGAHFCLKIYSKQGPTIEVFSRSPKIMIPENAWHKLLDMNRAEQLHFDVFVKPKASSSAPKMPNDKWNKFDTITNKIAEEDIDSYLVYRKIPPVYAAWRQMGIYQRNLHGFDESLVLSNKYFGEGCLNCHTFCNNRTDKMLVGIRSPQYGSSALLIDNGTVSKIGTKFGYTAWHPTGRVAAYSINKVNQFFHSSRTEIRDVLDFDSLLAYYLVDSKTVKTSPPLAKKDRLETYPTWSADGRYLYFCSAPLSWSDHRTVPQNYDQLKYDLVRVSYDVDHDQWGELETVLSAEDTGKSILLPRISPDGRWLLFCMCDYGCFPVYQAGSDLYMMDLKAARQPPEASYKYRRLDINSDQSESWHTWSSNGRWIAYSSKRKSGVFTRIYLAYVDEQGKVYKPILLPQKDPTYYDSCLWTFSVPELVTEPVRITKEKLGRVVRSSRKISVDMPVTMATPTAGALPSHDEPWRQERQ